MNINQRSPYPGSIPTPTIDTFTPIPSIQATVTAKPPPRSKCYSPSNRWDSCPPGCEWWQPLGCIPQGSCTSSTCPICLSSSTTIDAKQGSVNIKDLRVGMSVWTINKKGKKELQPIVKLSSVEVGRSHRMVHVILDDGRDLFVSPNHPIADGRLVRDLKVGEIYDSTMVRTIELVPYDDTKTYDLLPAGDTGYYFANGILMGSTLTE